MAFSKQIRSYLAYGLICFILTGIFCCQTKPKNRIITVQWKDNKAIAISIPRSIIEGIPTDSGHGAFQVRLQTAGNVPIMGEFNNTDTSVIFTPLIPFTRGLSYNVSMTGKLLGTVTIPEADSANAPSLIGIYPSSDSLPENLLKIHLYFSQPMREAQSGKYVSLIKNHTDTIKGAFLDLQPELWNEDRTMLTLWLDPGRIKRDLIPNRKLGAPLQKNETYRIAVSSAWKNQQGLKLTKSIGKFFIAVSRDSLCPQPGIWKISKPRDGTFQPLDINFKEALDYTLLSETLHVLASDGRKVPGKWKTTDHEKQIKFTPASAWRNGAYTLLVQTRLEDLAGNNINRPFDRDITQKTTPKNTGSFVTIPLRIAN